MNRYPTLRHASIILTLVFTLLLAGSLGSAHAQDPIPPTTAASAAEPQAMQAALGTSFTYQGRLNDAGNPANGAYDFQFKLWDQLGSGSPPVGGNQVGSTFLRDDLSVSGGLFTTDLDFGASAFDGQARWLEVWVRPGASTGNFTRLDPRRALLASPYATYSNNTRGIAVASDGRVGIGTSDPSTSELRVQGALDRGTRVFVGNAGRGEAAVYLDASNGDFQDGDYAWILQRDESITTPLSIRGDLAIGNHGDADRITVKPDGRVGIGTSDPGTSELRVQGALDRGTRVFVGNSGSGEAAIYLDAWFGDFEGSHNAWIVQHNYGDLAIGNGVADRITVKPNGRVGIGTTDPQEHLDVAGTIRTDVLQIDAGADLAEPFAITGQPEPGQVVAIDPDHIGQLRISDKAYDRTVAGIISGAGGLRPGLTMQQPEVAQGETHPVALTGRVYVWADASFGAIQPGDLLTTSATPGHAMRVGDYAQAQGAILGKAMSRLEEGKGLVLVLVSLQ